MNFGQNRVNFEINDVEFLVVVGGCWCKVIFMSNTTFVLLGCVELWLTWGCDKNNQVCRVCSFEISSGNINAGNEVLRNRGDIASVANLMNFKQSFSFY